MTHPLLSFIFFLAALVLALIAAIAPSRIVARVDFLALSLACFTVPFMVYAFDAIK